MPLVSTDLKTYRSTNNLGGAITVTQTISGIAGNVFDTFTGAETSAGATFYHCVYVKNTHGTLTAIGATVHVEAETVHAGIDVEIALGESAVNVAEQSIVNENTAPSNVTFSDADGIGNALTIGDIPPGEYKAIWFKVVIAPGTAAKNNYQTDLAYTFDTAE